MAIYKGDNSTITLIPETTYAKPISSYTGAKVLQNNDGTFNATRNALESEARTPNAELAGVRLGNKQVAGTFPVELDPENYSALFESVFYGRFANAGTEQAITNAAMTVTKKYELTLAMTSTQQDNLQLTVGNLYRLHSIKESSSQRLHGVMVCLSRAATTATFMHVDQKETTWSQTTDFTVAPVNNLRPAKQLKSFNAEETIFSEDGNSDNTARFMSTGCIASGVSIDLPSEGIVTGSFSFIGSNHITNEQYKDFDSNLKTDRAAHTSTVAHTRYDPLVLQDGAMISNNSDTLCQIMSGSISIENGAQTFFTGCSYEARGSFSGSFRVNVDMEVLFEGEDAYRSFENEESTRMQLKLKDRNSDSCLVLYIPSLRKTGYTKNNGKGLVSASITASAVVDPASVNSMILGQYVA